MKLSIKLTAGFSVIILFILIIGLFSWNAYRDIYQEFELLKEDIIPGTIKMMGMEGTVNQITDDLQDYMVSGTEEEEKAVRVGLELLEKDGKEHLKHERHIGQRENKSAQELLEKIGIFSSAVMEISKLKKQGVGIDELLEKEDRELHPAMDALVKQLREHKAVHLEELAEAEEVVHGTYIQGMRILLLSVLVIALLAAAIAIAITRSITRPIKTLHEGTEIVGGGNLDYKIGMKAKDEIGQLARAFDKMTRNLNRTTTGVDKLTEEVAHRKKTEEELRESRKRFRSLVETTSDWIWEVDRNGVYTYASPKVEALLGYVPEEVIGKTPFDLMPAEEAERLTDLFQAFIDSRKSFQALENTNLHKDGRRVMLETSGVPIFDDSDEFVGYKGIDRDITERKQAEEEIRRAAQEWKTTFASITDMVSIHDKDGKLLRVNKAFANVFGAEPEELIGKACYEVVHGTKKPWPECPMKQMLETKKPVVSEFFEPRLGIHLEVSGSPILNKEGEFVAFVHVTKDITERKRMEEELKQTLAELERSNAELEEFAYVASHDLQEPLRMVASYLQLIERRYKNRLDKDADEFIAFAVDGATRMQKMINKVLLYSRIGKQSKPLRPIDCEDILDQVVANLAASIQESGVIVTRDPLPTVMANDALLIELFQNLIGNAVKFRGKKLPGIHIKAEKKGSDWVFSVRDNGIGVDPRHAERIFQIFQRLHGRNKYPGTGIGLAVCKKIVERFGGRIWVESETGKGSTFYFTIPIEENKNL
jgi:PAS domain S-box-containing protein